MQDQSLESLFDSFRACGDARALEQVFDRTAPELVRVASHLAPDLAEAEDLVQATFVTAIERAANFERDRGLMGWLLGILANQSHNARRKRARRADPKELAREAGGDPAEQAERRELSDAMHDAIDALPDLYREIVAAHLIEGERSIDIAKKLGRAPGTVRMQLSRGLEQVRRALPVGVVAGSGLLQANTRGLAAIRAGVMEAGREATGALTAAGIGGVVIGAKIWAGLAVAIIALAWIVPRFMPQASEDHTEAESSLAPTPPWVEAKRASVVMDRDTQREELPTTAPLAWPLSIPAEDSGAPGLWLVGEVRGIGELLDSPILIQVRTRDGTGQSASGDARGDGPYRVDLTELLGRPGSHGMELMVSFGHFELEPLYLPLHVDADLLQGVEEERREIQADVELVRSAGFRGVVLLPDGTPAEGAEIAILLASEQGFPGRQAVSKARCDSNGEFALKTSDHGPCFLVACADGLAPSFVRAEIPDGELVDIGALHIERSGAEIRGRVQLPAGCKSGGLRIQAMRRAFDEISKEFNWRSLRYEKGRFLPAAQWTQTDESGAFVLGGLEQGESYAVRIGQVGGPHQLATSSTIIVQAPAEGLTLGAGSELLTVEVVEGARPVRARVGIRKAGQEGVRDFSTDDVARAHLIIDASVDYVVVAADRRYTASEVAVPAAGRLNGAVVTLQLRSRAWELATLVIEPVLVEGFGFPKPRVHLSPIRVDGFRLLGELEDHVAGHFKQQGDLLVVDELESGTYWVTVETGPFDAGFSRPSLYLPASFQVELAAGYVTRERLPLILGGAVSVRTVGCNLRDVETACVLLDDRGAQMPIQFVNKDIRGNETWISTRGGSILLGVKNALHPALPPGNYELRAELEGHRCEPLRFSVTAGSKLDLELRMTPE